MGPNCTFKIQNHQSKRECEPRTDPGSGRVRRARATGRWSLRRTRRNCLLRSRFLFRIFYFSFLLRLLTHGGSRINNNNNFLHLNTVRLLRRSNETVYEWHSSCLCSIDGFFVFKKKKKNIRPVGSESGCALVLPILTIVTYQQLYNCIYIYIRIRWDIFVRRWARSYDTVSSPTKKKIKIINNRESNLFSTQQLSLCGGFRLLTLLSSSYRFLYLF